VGRSLTLTVVRGGEKGRQFFVTVTSTSPIVAGRSSQCDITLAHDALVADRQFELRLEDAGLFLLDRAGGNTTRNGVPVARARVENGDLIGAGSTEVRVRVEAS
jgi:predicted component of type VI protein secretion system